MLKAQISREVQGHDLPLEIFETGLSEMLFPAYFQGPKLLTGKLF